MSDWTRAADLRPGDVVRLVWGGREPVEVTAVGEYHGPLRWEDYEVDHGRRWLVSGWRWNDRTREYERVEGLHATRPSFLLLYRRPEETP